MKINVVEVRVVLCLPGRWFLDIEVPEFQIIVNGVQICFNPDGTLAVELPQICTRNFIFERPAMFFEPGTNQKSFREQIEKWVEENKGILSLKDQ